jgi:hypothetical protein
LALHPLQSFDDQLRTLSDRPARGIEEQIVVPRVGGVSEKMGLDKINTPPVGFLNMLRRFVPRDTESAARCGNAIFPQTDQTNTQCCLNRQNLRGSPADNHALTVGPQRE